MSKYDKYICEWCDHSLRTKKDYYLHIDYICFKAPNFSKKLELLIKDIESMYIDPKLISQTTTDDDVEKFVKRYFSFRNKKNIYKNGRMKMYCDGDEIAYIFKKFFFENDKLIDYPFGQKTKKENIIEEEEEDIIDSKVENKVIVKIEWDINKDIKENSKSCQTNEDECENDKLKEMEEKIKEMSERMAEIEEKKKMEKLIKKLKLKIEKVEPQLNEFKKKELEFEKVKLEMKETKKQMKETKNLEQQVKELERIKNMNEQILNRIIKEKSELINLLDKVDKINIKGRS